MGSEMCIRDRGCSMFFRGKEALEPFGLRVHFPWLQIFRPGSPVQKSRDSTMHGKRPGSKKANNRVLCYRLLAFPPTFNICCLRFSAVGGSTRSLDARSWSNPKPFSASNTTPGPTARPLGVPLAALVPSDPETFQNTSHFHPVTQHNGFLEKVCYNSFFIIVAVVLCYRDAPRGCLRTSQRFGR